MTATYQPNRDAEMEHGDAWEVGGRVRAPRACPRLDLVRFGKYICTSDLWSTVSLGHPDSIVKAIDCDNGVDRSSLQSSPVQA
jgi:hypothetical protein